MTRGPIEPTALIERYAENAKIVVAELSAKACADWLEADRPESAKDNWRMDAVIRHLRASAGLLEASADISASLSYYVGNPSAWERYDGGVSSVIEDAVETMRLAIQAAKDQPMTDAHTPTPGLWVVLSETWNGDDGPCTEVYAENGELICAARVKDAALIARAPALAAEVEALKARVVELEPVLTSLAAKEAALRRVQGITNELSWNTRTRPIANQLNLAMAQPAAQALPSHPGPDR